jgi:hypothetical protein
MSRVTRCDRCLSVVERGRSTLKRTTLLVNSVEIEREWELCQSCHEDFDLFINPKLAPSPRTAGPG